VLCALGGVLVWRGQRVAKPGELAADSTRAVSQGRVAATASETAKPEPTIRPGTAPTSPASGKAAFSYSDCLLGQPGSLQVNLARMDRETRTIECGGVDTARPQTPFTWDWGDGQKTTGFFPQSHTYGDSATNPLVRITSHYPDGTTGTATLRVRFAPATLLSASKGLRPDVRVLVPRQKPSLRAARASYGVSSKLTVFDDSFFQACARETIEQVLSVAASVQMDLANDDVCRTAGRFDQVLLRDADFGEMYSLWFTEPMAFGVGDGGLRGQIQWSSFFHEMGHNVTLNSPAKFHWGFKQDGPANAIYSETMAQIFQHATACELLNNARKYGLSDDLARDIEENATATMKGVRSSFESYKRNGCKFCSWNDAKTDWDGTFDTFMTVAYKFFEHAEKGGVGYREPTRGLMAFLQRFNPDWEKGFSAHTNSPAAERFRATLMVAALSHAFKTDLRQEFRELLFPIDDVIFRELRTASDAQAGNGP